MLQHNKNRRVVTRKIWASSLVLAGLFVLAAFAIPSSVSAAINPLPIPAPKSNSYGLEATKQQAPPSEAPVITSPGGGSTGNPLVTVGGICKDGLLVQVYDNGVLVGAVDCKGGSFSIQITLFPGQNDLTAIQYDELGQGSPVSNTVSITYNVSVTTGVFGPAMTLTSNYGRRSANPNTTLTWPMILSGGTGPYAVSVDWGDGSTADLKSLASSGEFEIGHIYKQPGLYHVIVKVTDVNGVSAFMQLVAIANGNVTKPTTGDGSSGGGTKTVTKVLWLPAIICVAMLPLSYWLGRRSELVTLRHRLEKEMADYKDL